MPPKPIRTSQKRAAGSTAEGSLPQKLQHKSKKTRFVDPSEDSANFADEVDSALENPSAKRKGRVRNEGYDSDSSNDGEGVVPSRNKKGGDKDGDDDDDMFAIGEEQEKKEEATGKKKKEEYLRLGDIEGQEFGDNSDSDEGSVSEDEPEDEDDAERRKKAGMGFELSSFNMRDEMEEGKFTEDGTYVRSFDPHGVHDKWMEGLDEKEIKLARRRKKQQEKLQKERMRAEEQELADSGGKEALERELLGMLKKGETVLEALQRLGTHAKKIRTKIKGAKSKTVADDAMSGDKQQPKAPSDIDHITHLASNIMSLGDTDIYSKTYEELVRAVRSSGQVDSSWVPASADVKYEFKWDVPGAAGPETGDSFGPFGEDEMRAWYKASYFGSVGEKVKVREVGGEWGNWDDIIL